MRVSGIDTLEIGIDIDNYEETFFNLLNSIDNYKRLSQNRMKEENIEINDVSFFVSPKGIGLYGYRLNNNDFIMCFMRKTIKNTPQIYIKFKSIFLWQYGYLNSYTRFMNWFLKFNAKVKNVKIVRVDVCFDTDEVDFCENDLKNFFSRSRTIKKQYADTINYEGKIFSGFTIGKGKSLLARIYNKTLEIKHSNKVWFKEIWLKNSWNGKDVVWRVEFQIRAKVLKELGILNINDLEKNLIDIWAYLTKNWLIMRNKCTDTNKSRWKVKKKWKIVQSADFSYTGVPKIRTRALKGDKERLMAQCGGILTSIAAINGEDNINNAFLDVCAHLKDKAMKSNTTIKEEIQKRKHKYI